MQGYNSNNMHIVGKYITYVIEIVYDVFTLSKESHIDEKLDVYFGL